MPVSELINSEIGRRDRNMLETITTVCRAIASDARLLILHELASEQELEAVEIARRTGLTPDDVCHHTQRLRAAALVGHRRSGPRVFCRLTAATRDEWGPRAAVLVRRACRDPEWATSGWGEDQLVHLLPDTARRVGLAAARAFDVMFDAATAFGNVRRLQLVSLLLEAGPCGEEHIVQELSMSRAACWRHADKLLRRGVLRHAAPRVWALAGKPRTRFHGALTSLVVGDLRGQSRS